MHESVLMSKPVSSLILLIVFVKCLWAPGVPLIPSAKGDPSASGDKLFTCNGHFYPWAGVQDQSSVWCCTWANAPSRLPPTLSPGFGAQPGPSCPRKALAGLSAAWSQREPGGSNSQPPITAHWHYLSWSFHIYFLKSLLQMTVPRNWRHFRRQPWER